MKKILLGVFQLFVVINFYAHSLSADEGKFTYFFIEELDSKNYLNWIEKQSVELKKNIKYVCLPAKIIGVERLLKDKFEATLKNTYQSIQIINLTSDEAEQKCAEYRKPNK